MSKIPRIRVKCLINSTFLPDFNDLDENMDVVESTLVALNKSFININTLRYEVKIYIFFLIFTCI